VRPQARSLRLAPGEIRNVLAIEQRLFAHPWTLADFEWLSQDGRSLNLGLWKGEELVGYAVGAVDGPVFHLASLAVDGPCQRRGWGGRLLHASLERAAGRGCRSCRLEVRRSNVAAQRLYAKFEFVVDGVRRRFYTKPVEDAWLLSRPLPTEPESQTR
jgi:ribosomal-protein-alanine N-acetyltransferase